MCTLGVHHRAGLWENFPMRERRGAPNWDERIARVARIEDTVPVGREFAAVLWDGDFGALDLDRHAPFLVRRVLRADRVSKMRRRAPGALRV
jgi:hypothetical protein